MLLLLALQALAADPQVDVAFTAGSYGRVQMTSDLQGGRGEDINVASYAPRLEKGPYLELDLKWTLSLLEEGEKKATFGALITPAFSGDLFHFDAVFSESLALRNLYAWADLGRWGFWAGSRMYRGDDLYLLDFWPLDQLNTLGGGATFAYGGARQGELALHLGANRLFGDDWQFQQVPYPEPGGVGVEEVLVLDRQRLIASARWVHHFKLGADLTFRTKAYAEVHTLPPGDRVVTDPGAQYLIETLADDFGMLGGLQATLYGWAPQSFVHLWFRYATGLAAYGEMTIPSDGLDLAGRTRSARSAMIAFSGNHEGGPWGVMFGGYVQNSLDADSERIDFDDRWQYVVDVRPQVYVGRYFAPGIELSHQMVRPNGLNPRTNDFDVAQMTKASGLLALQLGKGGFTRPRLQAVYTATFMNEGARSYFNENDVRIRDGAQHFIGIGAEWWLNQERVVLPQ